MNSNNNKEDYTTIVFCGGSSKCISFCGALQYLNEYNMMNSISHVVGVSAGSLIGLFYIL
jgi:predicted acylesterase/phospholipase RssA